MGLNGLTLRILARWAEIAPLYRCATTTYMPPHPILYLRPSPSENPVDVAPTIVQAIQSHQTQFDQS